MSSSHAVRYDGQQRPVAGPLLQPVTGFEYGWWIELPPATSKPTVLARAEIRWMIGPFAGLRLTGFQVHAENTPGEGPWVSFPAANYNGRWFDFLRANEDETKDEQGRRLKMFKGELLTAWRTWELLRAKAAAVAEAAVPDPFARIRAAEKARESATPTQTYHMLNSGAQRRFVPAEAQEIIAASPTPRISLEPADATSAAPAAPLVSCARCRETDGRHVLGCANGPVPPPVAQPAVKRGPGRPRKTSPVIPPVPPTGDDTPRRRF